MYIRRQRMVFSNQYSISNQTSVNIDKIKLTGRKTASNNNEKDLTDIFTCSTCSSIDSNKEWGTWSSSNNNTRRSKIVEDTIDQHSRCSNMRSFWPILEWDVSSICSISQWCVRSTCADVCPGRLLAQWLPAEDHHRGKSETFSCIASTSISLPEIISKNCNSVKVGLFSTIFHLH